MWVPGALKAGEGTTVAYDPSDQSWRVDALHAGLFTTLEDSTEGIAIAGS